MVKKRFHFSLQTKIMGLIAALLVFVIGLLTITLAVQHTHEERRQAEQLAVQTARTISYMPPAKELIERKGGHADETQEVIEQMKEQTGAYAIYVLDEKGDIRSASIKSGQKKLERSREILFGGSHVSETKADGQRVIRGSAPIIKEQKGYSQVIGSVSVDFLKTETEQSIKKHLRNLSVIAVLVLLLSLPVPPHWRKVSGRIRLALSRMRSRLFIGKGMQCFSRFEKESLPPIVKASSP